MKESGNYDASLQMFREPPKPIKINTLLFERWLVQNGRGEHFPEGLPAGEFAMAMVIQSNKGIEKIIRDMLEPESLKDHISQTELQSEKLRRHIEENGTY